LFRTCGWKYPWHKKPPRKVHIPSADHPWRKWNYQVSDKQENQREKLIEVAAGKPDIFILPKTGHFHFALTCLK